jgi:hypothetical protein
VANWWLFLSRPGNAIDGYPLGDYIARGPEWTQAQVDGGMALYGIPVDWADHTDDGWGVDMMDAIPKRGKFAAATRHDGPPVPD